MPYPNAELAKHWTPMPDLNAELVKRIAALESDLALLQKGCAPCKRCGQKDCTVNAAHNRAIDAHQKLYEAKEEIKHLTGLVDERQALINQLSEELEEIKEKVAREEHTTKVLNADLISTQTESDKYRVAANNYLVQISALVQAFDEARRHLKSQVV